jgi:hypothetical protein
MKMQREAFVSWRSYFTPLIRGWGRQLMKVSSLQAVRGNAGVTCGPRLLLGCLRTA